MQTQAIHIDSDSQFLHLKLSKYLRLRLHGTLERFCMEPFRVGTDRLPVYTMSWNRSVQNRSFQNIHALTIPNDSLSFQPSRTRKILEKVFPKYNFSSKALPTIFFASKFFSYSQPSSVEFPLPSFQSVLDESGSGSLHENTLARFRVGPTF